jgi:rhodanese-related sulfurtransferase
MSVINTIQKFLCRHDQSPIACLACLLTLALITLLVPGYATNALAYTSLSPSVVKTMVENGTAGTIIDVRDYGSYCSGQIPCALNYPWTEYLQSHYTELDPDSMYLIVCQSGIRSAAASSFLEGQGFTKIYTMSNGMSAWGGETQTCDTECPALYFPHVATMDGWQTEIAIINTGNQIITGTLKALSDEGQIVKIETVEVPAHGRTQMDVATEFTNLNGYIIFNTRSAMVQGYTKFYWQGIYGAAIPASWSGTGALTGIFPKIEKNGGWTGIAFVNTEANEASVTLTAYNDTGNMVTTEALSVPGYAKVVDMAELVFSQDISGATYIAYSSDRSVVGFQLNCNADGTILDGLPGM